MILPHSIQSRLFPTQGRSLGFYFLAHGLYSALVGGFEIAMVLRLTGQVKMLVVFNMAMYVLLYGFFIVGTMLLRSGKVSRSLRADLLIQAASGIWALVNFGRLDQYWVLGALFVFRGMSEGIYWSTRHSALLACIPDSRRDAWGLKLQILTIIMSVVIPVISGTVISFVILDPPDGQVLLPAGYYPVFLLSSILALLAFLVSPKIRIGAQTVSARRVLRLQSDRGLANWRLLLASMGISAMGLTTAVGILNFQILKTEFNIGVFTSWIAAGSAIFFFVVRRLVRRHQPDRSLMVGIGIGGEALSRMLYFFFFNMPGLVAKSFADSFIAPLRNIFGENILRARIERVAGSHGINHAEVILYQESVLFVFRILALTGLIVVLGLWQGSVTDLCRVILMIFMAWGIIDFVLYRRLHLGNGRGTNGEKNIKSGEEGRADP